jgi:hypothetical protein
LSYSTHVQPRACDDTWEQQFKFNDDKGTIELDVSSDFAVDGQAGVGGVELHTYYNYYSNQCPPQNKDLATLNQQWVFNKKTKWIQLKYSPQKAEANPIPACLTVSPATADAPGTVY